MRSLRELKEEDSGLGRGVRGDALSVSVRVAESWYRLDHHRLRPSRGYLTAVQCDARTPPWYTGCSRARFHAAACKAIEAVEQRRLPASDERKQVREAILATMESFGLVKRTEAMRPASAGNAKAFRERYTDSKHRQRRR